MSIAELNRQDLEKAVGGTFTLNYYRQHEYEEAGIKVATHFIAKDEFWWKGENIGEKKRELRGVLHRGKRQCPQFA